MDPRRTEGELLYADGQSRRVTVLGWLRLDVTHRNSITDRWIFWLVHLRLPGGGEGWFEYDSRNLRPPKNSS
jgi:hypothetical protein